MFLKTHRKVADYQVSGGEDVPRFLLLLHSRVCGRPRHAIWHLGGTRLPRLILERTFMCRKSDVNMEMKRERIPDIGLHEQTDLVEL